MAKMQENTDRDLGRTSEEIINECMVLSALQSTELALESGLRKDQIIISCKTSRPRDLIAVYRDLARKTDQPLHLGLTEAGMGTKGLVWSASAMGVLLNEGIGDTIRVSLTPRPGGDRREEVYAACELLQALGLRSFAPSVTACPGCGRTTSSDVPGAGRAHAGLHPRADAGVEDALRGRRDDDARGHGLRRQRPRRVEGRQHRHQPARAPARRRTAPSTSTASTTPLAAPPPRAGRSASWSTTTSRRGTRGSRRRRPRTPCARDALASQLDEHATSTDNQPERVRCGDHTTAARHRR